jgi:hypothetical protein
LTPSTSFSRELINSVSAALGIEASRVSDVRVDTNPVRVTFTILPPTSSDGVASDDAVQSLVEQLSNTTSPLRSASAVLGTAPTTQPVKAVVVETPDKVPTTVPTTDTKVSSFDHEVDLHPDQPDGPVLRWSIVGDDEATRTMVGQLDLRRDSWASFGIKRPGAAEGGMADQWVLAVFPRAASAEAAHVEFHVDGVLMSDVHTRTVKDCTPRSLSRFVRSTGRMLASGDPLYRFDFERPMRVPSDSVSSGGVNVLEGQEMVITTAWGTDVDEGDHPDHMRVHAMFRSRQFSLNFGTGSIKTLEVSYEWLVWVHGVSMGLSWFVFIPVGTAIALLGKDRRGRTTPKTIRRHTYVQWAGVILSSISFLTAFILVGAKGSEHFATLHNQVGLAMLALPIVTSLMGFVRPSSRADLRKAWRWTHRALSLVVFVLSIIAMVTGLLMEEGLLVQMTLALLGITAALILFLWVTKPRPSTKQAGVIKPGSSSSSSSTTVANPISRIRDKAAVEEEKAAPVPVPGATGEGPRRLSIMVSQSSIGCK